MNASDGRGGDGAREGLVEVMVRIDETGQEDVTLEVEDFVGGFRKLGHRPDLLNEAAANKKTTLGNLPLVVVHGDDVGIDKFRSDLKARREPEIMTVASVIGGLIILWLMMFKPF